MDEVAFPFDKENFFLRCVKHKNIPKNNFEKQVLLLRLVNDFEDGKLYSEQEVNKIIEKYFEDYTTLRREFVNFRYMQRNPSTGEYWVVKRILTLQDIRKNGVLRKDAKPYGIT